MLKIPVRNAILSAFVFTSCAAFATIDWTDPSVWKRLRNANYAYNSHGGPAFEFKYDVLNFKGEFKLLGIRVPRILAFSNLRVKVYAENIGERELRQIDCGIPFMVEAKNFTLTVVGSKHVLVLSSKKAFLNVPRTVVLEGNVEISISGNRKTISNAVLTLEGRTLKLRTRKGSGIDLNF